MIPVIFCTALALAGIALLVYSFIDSQNRAFGNIVAAGIAGILFLLLGYVVIGGGVGDTVSEVNNQTVSGSVTTYTYTTVEIPFQDRGAGYLLVLLGVLSVVYIGIYLVGAILEAREIKADREHRHFMGDDLQ